MKQVHALNQFVMNNPGFTYEIGDDDLITLDLNILGSRIRDYVTLIEQQHADDLRVLVDSKLTQMHNKLLHSGSKS